MAEGDPIVVTGVSGYIAMHIARELLERGYSVRGTVRRPERTEEVRAALAEHTDVARFEATVADLTADDGWAETLSGAGAVIQVASPFPSREPKDELEVIGPAREGMRRVLTAAAEAEVKRVVITSSLVAVQETGVRSGSFDESSWSDPELPISAYARSKTLAERDAWDFIENFAGSSPPELVSVNPALVLGPLLSPQQSSTSLEAVRKLLAREVPGCPSFYFPIVDVRDVADAHIRAMTAPEAAGKRYLCVTESRWFHQIAETLAAHAGPKGYKVPTRRIPGWVVRIVALFDPTVRMTLRELGRQLEFSSSRLREELGWTPRPVEETLADTADSLIAHGIVP